MFAAYRCYVAVVRVFLESGADVQRADVHTDTALHYAASDVTNMRRLEMCRLLLDWGAEVDHEGLGGNTALHLAVTNGDRPLAEVLVERGANVTLKNADGQTAADSPE
jgi:ankyrin repeat protein